MSTTGSQTDTPDQPMLRIPRSARPTMTTATRTSRRVPVLAYVGIVLALVAGTVVGSQSLGWFATSGQVSASTGERVVPVSGASTGDIKGWTTIQQVIDAYPVTQSALYAYLAIPIDTPTSTTLSELKEAGTGSWDVPALRSWIDDGTPTSP